MNTIKSTFKVRSGLNLAASIDLPETDPVAYALFSHCFTCNKDLPIAVHIGRSLTAEGIALVRFDLPGLGESPGDFGESTLSSNVEDTLEVARQVTATRGPIQLLIGHSFGGPTALLAAHELSSVKAVATIASPSSPIHVRQFFVNTEFGEKGIGEIVVANRHFRINRRFAEDLDGHHMKSMVSSLEKSLIVFHSPIDSIVGVENAAEIFGAAKHPKSFVSLNRADHIVSDMATAKYLGHVLSAWAHYYISPE